MLLALVVAAHAECTIPRTAAELEASVAEVEAAWGESATAFGEALGGTRALLGCVNVPLSPSTAARLLRLRGLEAFLARDTQTAALAFTGARAADPAITLPESMAPTGNPLRAVWDTPMGPAADFVLREPRRGRLYVDGLQAKVAPGERPFVFQWIDGVRVEGALATAADLPDYPKKLHPAAAPLMVASGASAAAAAVLYGLAWGARADWEAADDVEAFDASLDRTNTLSLAAVGAGVGAVGLLGTSLVVARW